MNKKRNIIKTLSVIAATLAITSAAYAQDSDSMIAIGAKVGTAGVGIEARTPIVDNVYGRLGVNIMQLKPELSNSDNIKYKAKVSLLSIPLMIDYHPIDNSGFRVSAGLAYNGNKVTATATPDKDVVINNHTYSTKELGKLKSTLTLGSKIAPVVSIGYDNSFISDNAWSFNAEAGAMFSGKPKIKVSATGLLQNDKDLMKDLNTNAKKALGKVQNKLKIFPILSVGFKYSF